MKISDSQPPPSDPNVNTDDPDSSQSTDKDGSSSFSQVLAKKRGGSQEETQSKSSKQSAGDADSTTIPFMPMPKTFDPTIQTAPAEAAHVVTLPPELQSVVREISVAVNTSGNQQVNIELNSNVLKGLHIRIEKQDGAVAIQFQSTSDQVANLVSRNVEALSQGLAERGVEVGDIRVVGPRESAKAQGDKGRANSGDQGQGGRQGSRR